jgi:hypothetical protein
MVRVRQRDDLPRWGVTYECLWEGRDQEWPESTSNPNVLGMDAHQAFMARSVPATDASAALDIGEPQGLDWPAYQAAQQPQR